MEQSPGSLAMDSHALDVSFWLPSAVNDCEWRGFVRCLRSRRVYSPCLSVTPTSRRCQVEQETRRVEHLRVSKERLQEGMWDLIHCFNGRRLSVPPLRESGEKKSIPCTVRSLQRRQASDAILWPSGQSSELKGLFFSNQVLCPSNHFLLHQCHNPALLPLPSPNASNLWKSWAGLKSMKKSTLSHFCNCSSCHHSEKFRKILWLRF